VIGAGWFRTGLELLLLERESDRIQERHYTVVDDDNLPGRFQTIDAHKRLHDQGVCAPGCKYCRFAGVVA